MPKDPSAFDTSAAITRSLLGWGVVAGPWYVVVGLTLALTRPGFDLSRHALSLLMLGDHGWMQRTCTALAAVMTLAAAYGVLRLLKDGRGLAVGALTAAYAVSLALCAVFGPDPARGFPAGADDGASSTSGVLHLVFGAAGFACLAAAALAHAGWARDRGEPGQRRLGLVCGALVLAGFLGGAALARHTAGVALLWLAVLAGWTWLALISVRLYRLTPHPVLAERARIRQEAA